METASLAMPTSNVVERAMLAWFPASQHDTLSERKPFTELELRGISDVLRRTGRESWARIPRIYTTLRLINQLDSIDVFIAHGISDVWFPFTHHTLPGAFKSPSSRFDFLKAQGLVLSKALALEQEDGGHKHFSASSDVPLIKVAELGKGGFGFVDRVLSTISHREYARKLIPRGQTFRKNKEILKSYERELSNLKRLSHLHIVELIGSYTDPRFVGIVMSPVADCNLSEFLGANPMPAERRTFLRTLFGCLTAAICYLHENCIRHKDIKPQNVLVRGHQVFVTDFGTSLDWTENGQCTTSGPTIRSPKYCAPEVANWRPRNTSSDMWSLGAVFVEIWTVLKGESVKNLLSHFEKQGTNSTCYYLNIPALSSWMSLVKAGSDLTGDNFPYHWISRLMVEDPKSRWSAQMLADCIDEANADTETGYMFSGLCCVPALESAESVYSSPSSTNGDALQDTSLPASLEKRDDVLHPTEAPGQEYYPPEANHPEDNYAQGPYYPVTNTFPPPPRPAGYIPPPISISTLAPYKPADFPPLPHSARYILPPTSISPLAPYNPADFPPNQSGEAAFIPPRSPRCGGGEYDEWWPQACLPFPLPVRQRETRARRTSSPHRYREVQFENLLHKDVDSDHTSDHDTFARGVRNRRRASKSRRQAKSSRSSSYEAVSSPSNDLKRGETRMSKELVEKEAVIDLRYPYEEDVRISPYGTSGAALLTRD